MSYKIPSWLPRKEVEGLKLVNELLKHIGVKGVVVGTYALFLQDAAKPYETKDIDVVSGFLSYTTIKNGIN